MAPAGDAEQTAWWPDDVPDVLSDVLLTLGCRGGVQVTATLAGDWGVRWLAAPAAMFHRIDRGTAWVRAGQELVELGVGDLVLVRPGTEHELLHAPGARALADATSSARPTAPVAGHFGPPGRCDAELVCGAFHVAGPVEHPLLTMLPTLVHLPAARCAGPRAVADALRGAASDAVAGRPGADLVVRRLSDVLLTEILRSWLEGDVTGERGWLAAVGDPAVGRAIAAIHRSPDRPWTVETLAREALMSRSAFAARFAELAGETPVSYLTRWRMALATRELARGRASVATVATRVGYASEAAFSRAFKRYAGTSPGAVRQQRPAGAAPAPAL